jgi:hypothetical protein
MNLLKKMLLAFLLLPQLAMAQVNDDFSDGDFTSGTLWSGDVSEWTINASFEMQVNGPAVTPTQSYLSTPSITASNSQWEFYVNPKCATSSGNYMIVTLISDQANLEGNYNGYYVMIGNTADEISLYRKDGATNSIIINGTDGVVSSSTTNPFKVKVIRDASNVWSLEIDNTGTGAAYVSQGTVSDATYTSSSFFGVMANYSASNNTKYYFDQVYVGPVIVDVTPPSLVSANVISATQLDVLFDEGLNQSSAETESNYSVNNGLGTPSLATRDGSNPALVHLTFATSMTHLINYTLTVNGVTDVSGNAIVSGTANFQYIQISTAVFRDVVINEIFADPSPQVVLPTTEFIEVYNRSASYFDLSGWTISDGSSTGTFASHILAPGDYVILCAAADQATYAVYGTAVSPSTWPSLNNTGDDLILKNASGTVIDFLTYDAAWYQDAVKDDGGWTLELINPTLPCSGSSNWIASSDVNGGTPGTQNSVYSNAPDISAPSLVSFAVVNTTQITVYFSENMDSLSVVNAIWNINNGISITSVEPAGPDFLSVNVFLSPALDPATPYEISLSGASDCSGNSMGGDTIRIGIGVPALPFEVVINEIFADPDGSTALPQTEFVELRNTTNKVINLQNYRLSDASSGVVFGSCVLMPYAYLILTDDANTGDYQSYGDVCALSFLPSLNNSGDVLSLRADDLTLIHRVSYSDSWYADATKAQGGWTLEMIDPANPCGEANNWRASNDTRGGTPGMVNSVNGNNPDAQAPKVLLVEALNATTVVVHFDEICDSVSMRTAVYSINNGINVTGTTVLSDRSVELLVSPALQQQVVYTLTATNCEDCVGNTAGSSLDFVLPDLPYAGDLIINEVLFDPRGSGVDFVEIYNHSSRYISLKDWRLANYSNDTIANEKIISDQQIILFPGEYLVLTTDASNIAAEYPLAHVNRILEMDALPSYNNDEGRVVLISSLNQVSDDFTYTSDLHFALLSNPDGVSLERIDFNRPSTESTNWHSAAEAVGFATPGYLNSQYLPTEPSSAVNAEPSTFSPDSDGYNDVVNVSYAFEQSGFVGTILIYDMQGRLVRRLMENELLGTSGVISWDGINDRREKANVGGYVIYMEVYDLSGKLKAYKIPVVLAAKM